MAKIALNKEIYPANSIKIAFREFSKQFQLELISENEIEFKSDEPLITYEFINYLNAIIKENGK